MQTLTTLAQTVNGISIDPSSPTFNLYSLLNVLRAEAGVVAQVKIACERSWQGRNATPRYLPSAAPHPLQLDTLPLSLEDRRRVQALAVPGSAAPAGGDKAATAAAGEEAPAPVTSDIVRLDVWVDESDAVRAQGRPHPHPLLHWFNDVSDSSTPGSPYHGWQSSLSGLLRPSWQLHPVAQNLYSVMLVGDLSAEACLRSVATAGFLVQVRASRWRVCVCVCVLCVSGDVITYMPLIPSPLPPGPHPHSLRCNRSPWNNSCRGCCSCGGFGSPRCPAAFCTSERSPHFSAARRGAHVLGCRSGLWISRGARCGVPG